MEKIPKALVSFLGNHCERESFTFREIAVVDRDRGKEGGRNCLHTQVQTFRQILQFRFRFDLCFLGLFSLQQDGFKLK